MIRNYSKPSAYKRVFEYYSYMIQLLINNEDYHMYRNWRKKLKLFFCSTYYHTLITLIKALENNETVDIVLWNDISKSEILHNKLLRTGCINKIYFYNAIDGKYVLRNLTKPINRMLYEKRLLRKEMPKFLEITLEELKRYSNIYFYNDVVFPARYCMAVGLKYHLIEDALDYFIYFDKYWNIDPSSFKKDGIKKRIKNFFGVKTCWGQNDECIDIEVNKIEGIKIPHEKVIEKPRKELFDILTSDQRKLIYNTYASDDSLNTENETSVIILTQPLFADGFVHSIDEQIKVYETLVEEYYLRGYHVFIKPHPRDEANYLPLIDKYNCKYIDKNLPSEILNYNNEAKFDEAVSITSTAINFLEHATQKRFMGKEYIKNILKK